MTAGLLPERMCTQPQSTPSTATTTRWNARGPPLADPFYETVSVLTSPLDFLIPITDTPSMVINHRSFYTDPRARQGHPYVDPSTVQPTDYIEYDNGAVKPAHAKPAYGPLPLHGPFRPTTEAQQRAFPGRRLVNVNANGVAAYAMPIMHYADRVAWVRPDGSAICEDAYSQVPRSASFWEAR